MFFRAGGHDTGDELKRTGRFCGGLIDDIKRKAPFIANGSDFIDALNLQAGLAEHNVLEIHRNFTDRAFFSALLHLSSFTLLC